MLGRLQHQHRCTQGVRLPGMKGQWSLKRQLVPIKTKAVPRFEEVVTIAWQGEPSPVLHPTLMGISAMEIKVSPNLAPSLHSCSVRLRPEITRYPANPLIHSGQWVPAEYKLCKEVPWTGYWTCCGNK